MAILSKELGKIDVKVPLEDTLETYNQKVEKILIGKQNQRGELIEVWLKLYV